MKRYLFLAGLLLVANGLIAQNFGWVRTFSSAFPTNGYALATDPHTGAVYSTGVFLGALDMDPGPGVFTLAGSLNGAVYLSKLDASGNFIWAKELTGTFGHWARAIVVDDSSNFYITGEFRGTVDFDPSASATTFTESGNGPDIFVAKYDSSGALVWARQMGGYETERGMDIELDASGNVYVVGEFFGTCAFGTADTLVFSPPSMMYNAFVAKLDPAGNPQWARQVEATQGSGAYGAAVEPSTGEVYANGYFQSVADLDPGPATYLLNSIVASSFLLKLDTDGDFLWARHITNNYPAGNGLVLDAGQAIYAAGRFDGTTDFDPSGNVASLTSLGSWDGYVWKLDTAGNYQWAIPMGGPLHDECAAIAMDVNGDVYVTGRFNGTAEFDPGGTNVHLTSAGMVDVFLAKVDQGGTLDWALRYGGTNEEWGHGLAVSPSGDVLTTGAFADAVDFDPDSIATHIVVSQDIADVYVLKMGQVLEGTMGGVAAQALLFPNPSSGRVRLAFGMQVAQGSCAIYDQAGRLVARHGISGVDHLEVEVPGSAGLYQVILELDGQSKALHLLKQ